VDKAASVANVRLSRRQNACVGAWISLEPPVNSHCYCPAVRCRFSHRLTVSRTVRNKFDRRCTVYFVQWLFVLAIRTPMSSTGEGMVVMGLVSPGRAWYRRVGVPQTRVTNVQGMLTDVGTDALFTSTGNARSLTAQQIWPATSDWLLC
jgi:hypothetical protein